MLSTIEARSPTLGEGRRPVFSSLHSGWLTPVSAETWNIVDNNLPLLNDRIQAGHIIPASTTPVIPTSTLKPSQPSTLGERGFILYPINLANCFSRSGHLSGKSYGCFVFPNWQHWQPGGGRHGHPTYPHSGCPRRDGHTYSGVIVEHRFDCLISLYS